MQRWDNHKRQMFKKKRNERLIAITGWYKFTKTEKRGVILCALLPFLDSYAHGHISQQVCWSANHEWVTVCCRTPLTWSNLVWVLKKQPQGSGFWWNEHNEGHEGHPDSLFHHDRLRETKEITIWHFSSPPLPRSRAIAAVGEEVGHMHSRS